MEEISNLYSDIINELTEDNKETLKDFLSDDEESFIKSKISKSAQLINNQKGKIDEENIKKTILKVDALITEEKTLKLEVKKDNMKLVEQTKKKIETLTKDEIDDLLNKKWIEPLINNINQLTINMMDDFSKNIERLSKKYSTTLSDLEEKINQVEKELSSMMDDLDADEFNKKGLMKFKALLRGEFHEK